MLDLQRPPPLRGSNYPHTDAQVCQTSNLDPVIICGDINGKSTLWSNQIQGPDTEGKKLETAIINLNLHCLNDGESTWTSMDIPSSSALDITLTTPSIASKCSWQILDFNHGSDHFPIINTINGYSRESNFGRPSFSLSDVCWSAFQEECVKISNGNFINLNDLNTTYEELIHNIHNALSHAGTRHFPNCVRKKLLSPWWDDECSDLIQQKNTCFRESRNTLHLQI